MDERCLKLLKLLKKELNLFWRIKIKTEGFEETLTSFKNATVEPWIGLSGGKDTIYELSSDQRYSLEEYLLWHGN